MELVAIFKNQADWFSLDHFKKERKGCGVIKFVLYRNSLSIVLSFLDIIKRRGNISYCGNTKFAHDKGPFWFIKVIYMKKKPCESFIPYPISNVMNCFLQCWASPYLLWHAHFINKTIIIATNLPRFPLHYRW